MFSNVFSTNETNINTIFPTSDRGEERVYHTLGLWVSDGKEREVAERPTRANERY